ncbi:MAG: homocysteine S-methyltransferase family protein [Candidatus Sericytochromatia bacterium]
MDLTRLNNPLAKPLLSDGGLGSLLMSHLSPEQTCVDLLCSSAPEKVQQAHRAFLAAGAEWLTTNTFCSDPESLKGTPWARDLEGLCLRGAVLARAVAAGHAQVAGSLGPGWKWPSRGEADPEMLTQAYCQRARGLLRGGVDWLWIETIQDPLQAEAAVAGCRLAMAELARPRPLALLVSPSADPERLGDLSLEAGLARLLALQPDLIGVNCARGPASVEPALNWLHANSTLSLACCPNAGLPEASLEPAAFASALLALLPRYDGRLRVLGGCCGVTPEHLQALRRGLDALYG